MTQILFTPGPTPIPDAVMARLSAPIIHHRSEDAKAIFRTVHRDLKSVFLTAQPVLILSSSGTGAIEAAMTTICRQQEKAIVLSNGKFAARWVAMLRRFGVNAVSCDIPLGEPATVQHLEPLLKEHPDCASVWIVHSETSTGTVSDIKGLSSYIRQHSNALVCIDSISSLCAHEVRMDEWDIDVLCTGSQKGLMLPPGLAFVALSERAWRAAETSDIPNYYFDLRRALTAYAQDNTPWTPAITLVCGLEASLRLILDEGLENVWQRHQRNADYLRSRLTQAGFKLFSSAPSNSVTSVYIPAERLTIVKDLRTEFGIRVAGGQDSLQSTIFRVGHLGNYTSEDMISVSDALESLLRSA